MSFTHIKAELLVALELEKGFDVKKHFRINRIQFLGVLGSKTVIDVFRPKSPFKLAGGWNLGSYVPGWVVPAGFSSLVFLLGFAPGFCSWVFLLPTGAGRAFPGSWHTQ